MIGCYECGELPGGRDRAIREMVKYKIAASDAGREILELAGELGDRPGDAATAKTLLEIHARLVRLEAEDDDDIHNIIGGLRRQVENAQE